MSYCVILCLDTVQSDKALKPITPFYFGLLGYYVIWRITWLLPLTTSQQSLLDYHTVTTTNHLYAPTWIREAGEVRYKVTFTEIQAVGSYLHCITIIFIFVGVTCNVFRNICFLDFCRFCGKAITQIKSRDRTVAVQSFFKQSI